MYGLWESATVHLVPAERAHLRTIDDHGVCEALHHLGDMADVRAWSERFAVLGDPSRLALLLSIHAVPDICVTDLAVATGMHDSTVSQALRLLRTAGLVQSWRDGRVVRYRIVDQEIHDLLHQVRPD